MKKFRIKKYQIYTNKIRNPEGIRFVLLADLHGFSYGRDNAGLIEAIRREKPDAVLSAGDMAVRTCPDTLVTACKLLKELAQYFPVYYALGNHEYKMSLSEENGKQYRIYEKTLKKAGVHILRNEHEHAILKGNSIEKLIGKPGRNGMQVLLAHNPKYGKTYYEWGADMILSGHYHGGVVRFSEHYGLSSPQYLVLPPFCCGDFHKGNQHMFVSAGLGEHTLPLRIHNPRELLVIDVKPSE